MKMYQGIARWLCGFAIAIRATTSTALTSLAAALLLPIGGVRAQSGSAPDLAIQQQIAPYAKLQRAVPVGKGRTINLLCLGPESERGHDSPTVVLLAGLGNWSIAWRLVQQPLAQRARVCAWDRAGYGFSSASPEPQDIVHTTADLEEALKGAGMSGPYVMVGHSLGAYEALRFTDQHRQNVIGLVLVDPAIPDQQALMRRTAPLFSAKAYAVDQGDVKRLERCAADLQGGTLQRGTPQLQECTATPAVPADFPALKEAIARLNAEPARLLTQASTIKAFDSAAAPDSHEVINAQRHYGDMPLIVLTAGRDESAMSFLIDGASSAEAAEFHKQLTQYLRDVWVPAHEAYAALSTRGRHQLVPEASHSIQTSQPQAVISAVMEVLDEARSDTAH